MSYTDNLETAIYVIFVAGSALAAYVIYKIYNSEDGFR